MKKKRIALRAIAAVGVILYLIFMPKYLSGALGRDIRKEWFQNKREPYTGIITVWHIALFKPYYGSLGATLGSIAKTVEKKHYGIFFDVIAMDVGEYNERLALGESPDIFSFPAGLCYIEQLLPIYPVLPELAGNLRDAGRSGELDYAVPYAMSGYILLVNTAIARERKVELPQGDVTAQWINDAAKKLTYEYGKKRKARMDGLSGSEVIAAMLGVEHEVTAYDRFLSKDAALAIADLRAASDIYALQSAGKGFDIEAYALALEGYTDLVQFAGLSRRINENKIPYAMEYITLLTAQENQTKFMKQGLLPVIRMDAGENTAPDGALDEIFGGSAIAKAAYEQLFNPAAPNAFLYQRHKAALMESARRALSGDEAGKDDFFERLKELVITYKMK